MPEVDVAERMQRLLPTGTVALLRQIGQAADATEHPTYVVGGLPRDLLLGRPSADIDVMVEGSAHALGQRLAEDLETELECDERFLTCKVLLKSGQRIDVATARSEVYQHPGALPDVRPATATDELGRRDFSINALAIRLNAQRFGAVLDPFGGVEDIRARVLRVLHEGSFADDPTRVLRAIRFAGRYRLRLEQRTEQWALAAITGGGVDGISADRRREELVAILSERRPAHCLALLAEYGCLRFIDAALRLTPELQRVVERITELVGEELSSLGAATAADDEEPWPETWMLHAAALLEQLGPKRTAWACERLKLTAAATKQIVAAVDRGRPSAMQTQERDDVPPSRIYGAFAGVSLSVPLMALALANSRQARSRIRRYVRTLRRVTADITGDDLLAEGYSPGPAFAIALRAALSAKLDGRAETREEQLRVALAVLEGEGPPDEPEAGEQQV